MLSCFLKIGPVVATEVGFHTFCLTLDYSGQRSYSMIPFISDRVIGKKIPEINLIQVCENTILGA